MSDYNLDLTGKVALVTGGAAELEKLLQKLLPLKVLIWQLPMRVLQAQLSKWLKRSLI